MVTKITDKQIEEIKKQARTEMAKKGYEASLSKLTPQQRKANSKAGNDKKRELRQLRNENKPKE